MTVFSRMTHRGSIVLPLCTVDWTQVNSRSCDKLENYISVSNRNFSQRNVYARLNRVTCTISNL